MKKVSTVAIKATRNLSQSKLTIGLDLGDRWSWYGVLDETGEVLLEQKLSTTPKAMREGMANSLNWPLEPARQCAVQVVSASKQAPRTQIRHGISAPWQSEASSS